MIPARVHRFRDPTAVVLGLEELGQRGLTPRGVLFIALDPRGETHLAIPDDASAVTRIRVGDKLTLKPPWEGRYFHFDAIHRLPGGTVLWNGDRRLAEAGCAAAVACAVAVWLKGLSARNVFLGCTPHQAGSWWTAGERAPVVDLHATGYDSTVVTASGLLARRTGEPTLYHLPLASVREGDLRTGWVPVYHSDLGNILMVERRVLNYSLVLTCEHGLVEIDVSGLPDQVGELARVHVGPGLGVVGRIDGGAFAVTRGRVEPWGLADVMPALLVGAPNQSLNDLPAALTEP
ncbi:MAG TPA: hypothetical protein VNO33_18125 [Kofleriaceae bacterium]|nr:hypothetical protein [Kofleriaceae bacterium]